MRDLTPYLLLCALTFGPITCDTKGDVEIDGD